MYCPKCGQQVSENIRFCSRCGLHISEVAEWLAGGGGLAVREEAQVAALSPRRKGMRRGAKVLFWGGILTPFFLALSLAVGEPFPLFLPFVILLAGLSWLLYSRIFGEEVPSYRSKQTQDVRLGTVRSHNALPPASDAGINQSVKGQVRTVELVQPPSVTEHTTKLLDTE